MLTVQLTRSFGEDDPTQLERAAAAGQVLLTFNRRHFDDTTQYGSKTAECILAS